MACDWQLDGPFVVCRGTSMKARENNVFLVNRYLASEAGMLMLCCGSSGRDVDLGSEELSLLRLRRWDVAQDATPFLAG